MSARKAFTFTPPAETVRCALCNRGLYATAIAPVVHLDPGVSVTKLPRVSEPTAVHALVADLKSAKKEHLIGIYLNTQNEVLAREIISIGSLNTTLTHPREVLLPAITLSAVAIILVHNHPSGTLTISRDDEQFTRCVGKACELMGVDLLDHIVVSRNGFVSLRELGLM